MTKTKSTRTVILSLLMFAMFFCGFAGSGAITAFAATPASGFTVTFKAVNPESGENLEGATLQVRTSDGTVLDEWNTTSKVQKITDLEAEVQYTLCVIEAPEGYKLPPDVTFTIDGNGDVTSTGTIEDNGLLVRFEIKTYTVTFVDYDGSELKSEEVKHGKAAHAPADPTREGYSFTGWDVEFDNVTSNLTVTAQWTINQYPATFHAGEGVFADGSKEKSIDVDFGTVPTAPEPPERAGYTFTGWTPALEQPIGVKGATYTATYTPNIVEYKVEIFIMDTTGAYGAPESETKTEKTDEIVSVTPENKDGFSVDTDASVLSGTVAADGSTVLKVYYIRNQYNFTVEVDGVENIKTYYYGEAVVVPNPPKKTGYTFGGWSDTIPATMPANDVIVSAVFTLCNHSGNTNKPTDAGNGKHGFTCSACEEVVTEDHTFDSTTGKCQFCGLEMAEAKVTSGGVDTYYETLDGAISDVGNATAADEAVVKLLKNVDLGTASLTISSGVFTLDLNDCELKTYGSQVLHIMSGSVTIADSGENKTKGSIINTVTSNANYCGVLVDGANASATIFSGAIESTGLYSFGVHITNNGTVTITSGTITGKCYGVYVAGGTVTISDNATIHGTAPRAFGTGVYVSEGTASISGGTITGTDYGIIITNNSSTVITGGEIVSKYGVTVNSGSTATITGGTITGTDADLRSADNLGTIKLDLGENGIGASFPNGITTIGFTLAEILADGASYWAGDTMITQYEESGITGRGNITVKATCTHENATYAPGQDDTTHTLNCADCNNTITEAHTLTYSASGTTITATCSADCGYEATATISVTEKTYDGTAVTANVSYSDNWTGRRNLAITYAVKDGETLESAPVKAGTYTAFITYENETASVHFTIQKKSVTATVVAQDKTYDGNTDTTVTANVTDNQLSAGDSITIAGLKGIFSDASAGEDKVVTVDSTSVSVTGVNADCYDIIYPSAIATINKAQAPEIVWSTANGLTYGQKLSESTLTSTDEFGTFAWQNGDTVPSVTNDGFVVVYTPNDTRNYDYTSVTLTKTIPVTVSPKKVTVTAGNITVCVGETYTLTYTVDGLLEGDTLTTNPTLNTNATVATAGEHAITASGATASDNYTLYYENGTLTVREHAYGEWVNRDAQTHQRTCECGAFQYIGHNWEYGDYRKLPTCVEQGERSFVCRDCGASEIRVTSPEEDKHSWNEGVVTTNPTCTEKGVKTFTCTHNSAHTYTEDVAIDENAHAWNEGVVTTNPTCTAKGVKTYTCTHNSAHTYTEDVDALGHKYDNACDATCNTCGEERTPAEHIDADENNACDECGAELPRDGLGAGAIAGIAAGSVAVLGGGGFALFWFVFRKKRII